MNIFYRVALLIIILLSPFLAGMHQVKAQLVEGEDWNLRTTVELESAYRTTETDFQKSELLVAPELTIDLPFNIRLQGIGRFRAEAFDELEPGQPPQRELAKINKRTYLGDHIDFELRELFVDFFIGPLFLKAGKQQVVWGKTDGLKLLDVVNPQNFREFVLDEFEDSRIPLWSLLAEVPAGDVSVQVVWIPDRTYHKLPAQNGDFRFRAPEFSINPPNGFETEINPISRPDDFFWDSDIGIRLSTFWEGWDLTLNYLYHYYDIPVVTRSVQIEPDRKLTIKQKYRRSHLLGLTFSNAFGDLTLRGEGAFSFNRYFRTDGHSDSDGVKKGSTVDYAIGLDWFGIDNTLISTQLFQNWTVLDNIDSLFRERLNTRISMLIRRTFMNERLEIEVLTVAGLQDSDGFIRPKMSYEWKSNINLWTGYDGFWGDRKNLIGQFNNQDRVVFGLEVGL